MARIIAGAVARLKQEVQRFLSAGFIAQLAGELGLPWRQTPLALPHLVALFARQILGGNLSMPELIRRSRSAFTPEAYCTARGRLPLELLQAMLKRVSWAGEHDAQDRGEQRGLWKGHRLWHMDGSSFSMPDTPELQKRFGQPCAQREGCGFPVAHILCLFDATSGLVQGCILSPMRTHDLAKAGELHPQMRAGDLLIADRAFESFGHIALLQTRGVHLLVPVHQRRRVDFCRKERRRGKTLKRLERRRLRRCGSCDQVVRWLKPVATPAYLTDQEHAALPETLDVREIKRVVRLPSGRKQTIVLITTLLDEAQYPAEELVKLLRERWQIEVNLRHLKTTMRMEILRSQSAPGIEKELWMFLIVYNLVRLIMLEAAQRQRVCVRRISFADALYWTRHGNLNAHLPRLRLVPERPGRVEPRVLKRRGNSFPFMRRPRKLLRTTLKCR